MFETSSETTSLINTVVGTIERHYGLLRCEERVQVTDVFDRTGDLAVADRLAFVYASRTHGEVAVFELDGWYYVGTLDRPLSPEQAASLRPGGDNPRLHSIVTERGIAPIVAPLVY